MRWNIKGSFISLFVIFVLSIYGCGSSTSEKTADTNSPTEPTNLTSKAINSNTIELQWDASTDNIGVKGYEIYRGSEKIGTTEGTNYSDINLNTGTKYCYTIKAYDAAGNVSGNGKESCAIPPIIADIEKPSAPSALNASADGVDKVNISWTGSSDNIGVDHYVVYRSTINTGTTNSTSYNDTGLIADTTYCYVIRATDAAGNISDASNEACAKTSAIADTANPTIPIDIVGTKIDYNKIGLSWSVSTDNLFVSGYEIYRGNVKIGTTNSTNFTDIDLNPDVDNCYTIKSYDKTGNISDLSKEICIGGGQGNGAVGSSGGTIEITDPNSPIKGTKVIVPKDALDNNEIVKITIGYEDKLPGPLEGDATAASKVIVLSKDSEEKFKQPVQVTIPYTDAQMDAGDIPAVFYWDSTYNKYMSIGIKDIDTVNKTITFTTVHFSNYVAIASKGLAVSLSSIDTGFRPGTDGFFHPNFGSYDSPGGSSLGMANFSSWYHDNKKVVDGSGLFSKYRSGDLAKWEDDIIARELISRAFISSSQIWPYLWHLGEYKLGHNMTAMLLITTMKITKTPQTFIFRGFSDEILNDGVGNEDGMCDAREKCEGFGHAVSVYRYDATTGKFYIYDSNFPNEEITVDWDMTSGFTNYSKAAGYPEIKKFGFEAFSSAFEANEFELLYTGAESGWANSKFQTINITSPALDANNTAIIADPNNVTITGTVTGGIGTAKYLVYNVNGTSGLGGQLVTLDSSGNFSFTIPNLPLASNSIMFMSTDDAKDATRMVPNAYAGFKEITIKIPGQTFFTNFGFETGDFTGWTHETHTWQNSTPDSYKPEKSDIESNGTDPIEPTIVKTYVGNYSARINNQDNSYHISSASQSATVPSVTNPQLKFYWAAVLEDPQHDAAHQPYVDIKVTDDTAGTTLYYKHFYTNDPQYSGWIPALGGSWKVIPWQVVNIDVSNAIGNQITITVLAADCGYGGHGGYVYLDGDE